MNQDANPAAAATAPRHDGPGPIETEKTGPGFRKLELTHLVLDYNGTLAVDGKLLPGRGGLTVSIRHLPALAEAIRKALEITSELQFEALNAPQNQ